MKFQHTAARRRLDEDGFKRHFTIGVSTHSRPKAAGVEIPNCLPSTQFQHTAARRRLELKSLTVYRQHSFNTQPPEGGWQYNINPRMSMHMFQHTAARRRLEEKDGWRVECLEFQHTAARRRLDAVRNKKRTEIVVSTHSRPKAAGPL